MVAPSSPAPCPTGTDALVGFWRDLLHGAGPRTRQHIYEEAASLLGAGIAVREALRKLADTRSGRARPLVEHLSRQVATGRPLGEAMALRPDLFSELEIRVLEASERSGRLEQAFRALGAHMGRRAGLVAGLVTGSLYPVFVLHLLLATFSYVNYLQHRSGVRLVLTVAGGLLLFWGALALVQFAHALLRSRAGYARFLGRLPVLGAARRDLAFSRFCLTFTALHDAGAAMDATLESAARATADPWIAAEILRAVPALRGGSSLAESVVPLRVLPDEIRTALATGETSGRLSETVGRLAGFYEERFERGVRRVVALLPAILTVVVGGLVLLFALDFYLAPFAGLR